MLHVLGHNRIRRGESDGLDKEQHVSICCGKEAAYPELPADCKALQLSPEEYDTSKWEYELGDAVRTISIHSERLNSN